jgi:RNA polymerase sigma-70 factor (ECF subfamily)
MDDQDADIVAEVLAGRRDAYGRLVLRHHRPLYDYVAGKMSGGGEAEDIVQRTFVSAYRHLAEYDPGRPMLAWLRGIALNHCRNERKDPERARMPHDFDARDREVPGGPASPVPDERMEALVMRDIRRAVSAPEGPRVGEILTRIDAEEGGEPARAAARELSALLARSRQGRPARRRGPRAPWFIALAGLAAALLLAAASSWLHPGRGAKRPDPRGPGVRNAAPLSSAKTGETRTRPAAGVTNLLQNGGFESGRLSGWNVGDGFTVTPLARYSGRFGVRMSRQGRIDQAFETVPGRSYHLGARVRIDRQLADPEWGGVRIQVMSTDWKELGRSAMLTAAGAPEGGWVAVRFSFVATTPKTRILFENFSGGGLFEASLDDVIVSPLPIPEGS